MDIGKIINMPKNSDFILFNTIYHNKTNDDGVQDSIDLVFKNIHTGEKILKRIDNPQIEVYVAKPEVQLDDYVYIDIDKDKTDIVDVSYKNILKDLSKLIGQEQYYWQCVKERRYEDLKRIQEYNRFFSSDRNIEDFYRFKCLRHFGEKDLPKFNRSFLDIEADIKKGRIDFKKGAGTAPVNAITFIDEGTMTSYTVLLRDPSNPLIEEFEKNIHSFIKELNRDFDEKFGKFTYKIAMFDDEIDLIKTVFEIINTLKPDFLLAWNAAFDFRYMIDRLKKAGIDPADIMCHPDFKYKECFYKVDTRNFEIKKKTDSFKLSSYTVCMDQMINYAAIRKGKAAFDSYKLDFIGGLEVGVNKLDYSDTASLKELPYTNYAMFVKYNIQDVLVQYAIEKQTNDVADVALSAYSANTRYDKIFKEITFLTNHAFNCFEADGIILGNNVNAIRANRDDEEVDIFEETKSDEPEFDDDGNIIERPKKKKKFPGAIVGDPMLIMKMGEVIIGNRRSNSVFSFVVDYDFTSLYPSILKMFNIYKSTLLGGVIINGEPGEREQSVVIEHYQRGAKFVEDYETREAMLVGYRWFNLPNFENVVDEFEKDFKDELTSKIKVKRVKGQAIKQNKKHKVKIKKKS